MSLGLYIHIPFCRRKCCYCDFPSYGGMEQQIEPYVQALCREIAASQYKGAAADTIYIGGGTPSLLQPAQIERILRTLRGTFSLSESAEVTMEANPDSMDRLYAQRLASLGINRVSMGIQSFDDAILQSLGRLHQAHQALQAVDDVFSSGVRNISIDLMYGLPGQSEQSLRYDLAVLSGLPVCHASIYGLILEEHTVLYRDVSTGRTVLPPDSLVESMARIVHEEMARMGFEHYEISSYCRPGFASRHNRKYWLYEPYIGFGVSAHSFDGVTRYANMRQIPAYIAKAGKESVVDESVCITPDRAVEDYCFLALRMKQGIDYNDFQQRFGRDIHDVFGHVIQHLLGQGLLEKTGQGCCLSPKGLEYGNYVFSRFIR
jgi:oxygen-independent coproporphyrinogen-3 oxidase